MNPNKNYMVFSGTATKYLAEKICQSLGCPLGELQITKFSDGEFAVSYEESIRGRDIFLVQSTFPNSDNLMELLLMIDAAKRASARTINAVIPYFGWARQDRKDKPRVSIGAKLVADLLSAVGIDRVITMDLHADQIQGFFNVPVDHLYASNVILPYLQSLHLEDLVIASPDVGGSKRANTYAKYLGCPLVLCNKTRARANVVATMQIIGDVEGKNVVIIDDMVDTAGTITKAADIMKEAGAKTVRACASHCVMSGPASERVQNSALEEIVFTDSIPYSQRCAKVKQISVAGALTACQSTTYQVNGTIEGAADGDTLFLTSDLQTGIPSDTIFVEDGKFHISGEADSVRLCMIYSAKRNELNAPFFIEPGIISIQIKETPGASRVGGTKCNDEWQVLNDSVISIGKEINRIAEHIYGNTVTPEEQQKGMEAIDKLNQRFSNMIINMCEKNIRNEFGYFLLTYYPDELINPSSRSRLIKLLPEEMRKREQIRVMEQSLEASAKTAEGATIPDFSQPAPDGTSLSIMSEVSQHRITIIDFWASWCGPCRQEIPSVIELYKKYKDKGLGIVGVSLDNDKDAWLTAIKQMNMPWAQMSDLNGWDNAAAKLFNITSIPHTIVVDQQGKILRHGLRGEALANFVAEQLQ